MSREVELENLLVRAKSMLSEYSGNAAKLNARVKELEAERDRLREALEAILEIECDYPDEGGAATDIAKQALKGE